MSGWLSERKPRGTRVVLEEVYNREGHWTRQFPVRIDPWSVVEHWASENKYYLVAFRGQRRLYQKETGWSSFNYLTYVDFKYHDGRMTVSSWIFVSLSIRLLSFLLLPSEMGLEPKGLVGVRKRRDTCREMNTLLVRFKQTPIVGSEGLHFLDFDPTTILLGGLCFLTLFLSLYVTTLKLQVVPALANILLWRMGNHLLVLLFSACAILVTHDVIVIRRWDLPLYKWLSASIGAIAFTVITILLTMKTGQEMQIEKLAFHCWYRFQQTACREQVERLTPQQRTDLALQLERLRTEIATKR